MEDRWESAPGLAENLPFAANSFPIRQHTVHRVSTVSFIGSLWKSWIWIIYFLSVLCAWIAVFVCSFKVCGELFKATLRTLQRGSLRVEWQTVKASLLCELPFVGHFPHVQTFAEHCMNLRLWMQLCSNCSFCNRWNSWNPKNSHSNKINPSQQISLLK